MKALPATYRLKLPQPAGEPNAYANVYANISIDYSKLHVTPDVMLHVLSGNAAGACSSQLLTLCTMLLLIA
jgi:hypothetical protein